MNYSCERCGEPDEKGDYEPCCEDYYCEALYTEEKISSCIHCGAEMEFDETGVWRHHSQMDLPANERLNKHYIQEKPYATSNTKRPQLCPVVAAYPFFVASLEAERS